MPGEKGEACKLAFPVLPAVIVLMVVRVVLQLTNAFQLLLELIGTVDEELPSDSLGEIHIETSENVSRNIVRNPSLLFTRTRRLPLDTEVYWKPHD